MPQRAEEHHPRKHARGGFLFLTYVRSTTDIRWRNTLSLYSLTESPRGLDDGANATGSSNGDTISLLNNEVNRGITMTTPGASRDCRETDLTTERRSLTTEVCPSWENASRSSERQNGITAVMSTASVPGRGWT